MGRPNTRQAARQVARQADRQGAGKGEPSPVVIKLQIAGAVFVPMLLLGLWLRSQGFW